MPPGPTALDSAPVIYFIERHPAYAPVVRPLFERAAVRAGMLVVSSLTLLEVLVLPYRSGAVELAREYEDLLTRSAGLELVDLGREVLRMAARLRAEFRLRTPDALQLACAVTHDCSAFVTNDRRIPRIRDLRIIQLSDFVET